MEKQVWRPGRRSWTDADGTTWRRGRPKWLAEKDARRFVERATSLVVVERIPGFSLQRLDDGERNAFWAASVAGHLDAGQGDNPPPNEAGKTYRASVWKDDQNQRLILLSEMC